MGNLCDTTCGGTGVLPTPYDANCVVNTRKSGANFFFLIKCDTALNLTDGQAVVAALQAGTIVRSPRGKLVRGKAETKRIEDAFGCGEGIGVGLETSFDYSTYLASCDSTVDDDYWKNVNDNYPKYRFFWADCCGKIYYDAGSDNPGFSMDLLENFTFGDGEQGAGQWTGKVKIKHNKDIPVMYDPVVASALGIG